jgi:predicted transcriptional regulator
MTEEEKLAWEIDKIRKEIEIDWAKLASKNLPPEKRKVIREHLEMCSSSLKILHERFESLRDDQ